MLEADLEAPPRQLVDRFQRLIAVGDAGEADRVALPGAPRELPAQELRRVHLYHDLALEVRARAPVQILVGRPSVAIRTRMKTSSVGIDGEAEADVRAVVFRDDRARFLLEDFQLRGRRFSEPLGMDRVPGIGRVGNRAHEGTLAEA